ncbi:hypothetical protein [Methylovirgula sp. 4M-Z18]|uniref:hypothetical protein n=1 Tax=Methylovirgula sp. 4M-Z18 TaxID=2293567 RepID=UPI000E2ECB8E|nr:hypothetical protein [Methylovirgula sp. 4M-Z18]RFB76338.1 hypothetical protein DYH55_21155 [Methylovirgula sp. 4M-Z18]
MRFHALTIVAILFATMAQAEDAKLDCGALQSDLAQRFEKAGPYIAKMENTTAGPDGRTHETLEIIENIPGRAWRYREYDEHGQLRSGTVKIRDAGWVFTTTKEWGEVTPESTGELDQIAGYAMLFLPQGQAKCLGYIELDSNRYIGLSWQQNNLFVKYYFDPESKLPVLSMSDIGGDDDIKTTIRFEPQLKIVPPQ